MSSVQGLEIFNNTSNVTDPDLLGFWENNQIFEKSIDPSKDVKILMDGPPFCTGSPHYGHIAASVIKDTLCRHHTQQGFSVPRCLSWDTHGLPIEFEIEKRVGIKTKSDVMDYGLKNYNDECRKIVFECKESWHDVIKKIGRWVDFDKSYTTMDPSYMNVVWGTFNKMWELGHVYSAYKIMPYSIGCGTPLSNFEAKSNYQEVSDPSLTLSIKITNPEKCFEFTDTEYYALVWTTTPWTLTSNLALCVNPDIDYSLIKSINNAYYLLATTSVPKYFKDSTLYKSIQTIKGCELAGLEYEKVFDYYSKEDYPNAYKFYADGYVSTDTGSGIVHMAPGFGQDDYRVCTKYNIVNPDTSSVNVCPCPVTDNGDFMDPISDYKGRFIKDCDVPIVKLLKGQGKVFKSLKEKHNYPYCWRSNTPLIQKAVSSWFINVSSDEVRANLLDNNSKINWVPGSIGEKRFGNWLRDSQDWCFSRDRFWGTPVPIWTNGVETICVKSSSHLEDLAGLLPGSIIDMHRDSIDSIEIPSSTGLDNLKRINPVFDCWFESGSMAYAINSDKDYTEFRPADFVVEGIDQTRGWFYTSLVISTLLDNKPPFKNVIVNGMVLDKNGKKMSKSKKNYPDPNVVIQKYGSDALRLYIIQSGLVKGEDLKFDEKFIRQLYNQFNIMLNNMVTFLLQNLDLYNNEHPTPFSLEPLENLINSHNILNRWILDELSLSCSNISKDLENYQLGNVTNILIDFVTKLSKSYLNMNKKDLSREARNKCSSNCESLSTLYYCLYYLSIAMAPFAPFISETLYQKLKNYSLSSDLFHKDSVHLIQAKSLFSRLSLNSSDDSDLVSVMKCFNDIVLSSRYLRTAVVKRMFKKPINQIIVINTNNSILKTIESHLDEYLKIDLNVNNIIYETNSESYVTLVPCLNLSVIGRKYGKSGRDIIKYFNQHKDELVSQFNRDKFITFKDFTLTIGEELNTNYELLPEYQQYSLKYENDTIVLMDSYEDQEMEYQFLGKSIVRFVQSFRKDTGLVPTDKITIFYNIDTPDSSNLNKYNHVISNQHLYISPLFDLTLEPFSNQEINTVLNFEDIITLYISFDNFSR